MEQPSVEKKPRKPRTKKADMLKKKAEEEKLKESQPPKKRGRKPKGGKITKAEFNIHQEIMEPKVVILHLKCKMEDLNINGIQDHSQYNPYIVKDIDPYNKEQDNSSFYTIEQTQSNTNSPKRVETPPLQSECSLSLIHI